MKEIAILSICVLAGLLYIGLQIKKIGELIYKNKLNEIKEKIDKISFNKVKEKVKEEEKEKYIKPEVKEEKKNGGRRSNRIKISYFMPQKFLIKYGLKIDDEFDSVEGLANYLGIMRGTVYNWSDKKWLEKVK